MIPPCERTNQTTPWIVRKGNKEAKDMGSLLGLAKIYEEKRKMRLPLSPSNLCPPYDCSRKVLHPAPTHIC